MNSLGRDLVSAVVLIAVLLAATVAALRYDDALRTLDRRADKNAARPYLDRSYGDDGSIVGSRRVIEDARFWIPEYATYRVVLGPSRGAYNGNVVSDFLRYFLLPRRESERARWILCLGCDISRLGGDFGVLSRDRGIVLGRLR